MQPPFHVPFVDTAAHWNRTNRQTKLMIISFELDDLLWFLLLCNWKRSVKRAIAMLLRLHRSLSRNPIWITQLFRCFNTLIAISAYRRTKMDHEIGMKNWRITVTAEFLFIPCDFVRQTNCFCFLILFGIQMWETGSNETQAETTRYNFYTANAIHTRLDTTKESTVEKTKRNEKMLWNYLESRQQYGYRFSCVEVKSGIRMNG